MQKEEPKKMETWKVVLIIVFSVLYIGSMVLLSVKKWIDKNMLILWITITFVLIILVLVVWFILKKKAEEEIKPKNANKTECREYLISELKKPFYAIVIDTDCDEFEELIQNLGSQKMTEVYCLTARIQGTKKLIRIGCRTDNLSKWIFGINAKPHEFMEKMNKMADVPSIEETTSTQYFDPNTERLLRQETKSQPAQAITKKEAEEDKQAVAE